jgi:tetratricopeptide (TPR) repeat protein
MYPQFIMGMGKFLFGTAMLRAWFFLSAALWTGNVAAQANVQQCLELLQDDSQTQVLSAMKAYALLDTLQVEASAKALTEAAARKPQRVQLRARALAARFQFYWLGPGDSLYARQMEAALSDAYAFNDPFMVAEFTRWYGEMLNSLGNGPLAAQYCMSALKMQQQLGFEHFYTPKALHLTTAEMLYRTMNYREACQYYAAAFRLPDDSLSPKQYGEFKTQLAHAMNAYGRAFYFLKKYDSSVYYLQQCMRYVQQQRLDENIFYLASDNRFDPYVELGQFDSCRKIANDVYAAGQPSDSATLVGACFMHGRIALRMGRFAEALKWGLRAEQYGRSMPKLLYHTYKDIIAAYEALGQQAKAVPYMEKLHKLEEGNNRLKQKASARFLEAESEFQKARIRLAQEQARSQRQVRNRNMLISALVLLAIAATVYFNRRRRRSERALRQVQEQFHFFETRYRSAEEQLAQFKQEVAEKNRQIESLESAKPPSQQSKQHAAQVDGLSRRIILTEQDWEVFREAFDAVYPGFFTALKLRLPDITRAEVRMACLIRLNFDTKHIAGMLGISVESVRKTRYRLKKRFGDDPEASLEDFIAQI